MLPFIRLQLQIRQILQEYHINQKNTPPSDADAAYSWYLEKVQNSEDPQPKYLNALGECYFYGKGTNVNYDSAFPYFQQAAESEYCNAQYNLGVCYCYGYGTDIDDENALVYFQLAQKDNIEAKAYVGYYYRGWRDLESDINQALEIYNLTQKNGSTMKKQLIFAGKSLITDMKKDMGS